MNNSDLENPLTDEEVARYQECGSILVKSFFSNEELSILTSHAEDIRTWEAPPADDPISYTQHFEHVGGVRKMCRSENLFKRVEQLQNLADGKVRRAVSQLLNEEARLFKDKINYKNPGGGGGYAPHCDGPSAASIGLAKSFVTAMLVLDKQTQENGCFRVVRGRFSEENVGSMLVTAKEGADPDAEGRVGALMQQEVDKMLFEPVECDPGDVFLFHGWVPHRSGPNNSDRERTAAFLIYNPASEGDHYYNYFLKLANLRAGYKHDVNNVMKLHQQGIFADGSKQQDDGISEGEKAMRIAVYKEEEAERLRVLNETLIPDGEEDLGVAELADLFSQ